MLYPGIYFLINSENEMVGGGNELRSNEFTAHYQTQEYNDFGSIQPF